MFTLPATSLTLAWSKAVPLWLFTVTQPGGSLYGLQHSNPVDTSVAYGGDSAAIGTAKDPMVGRKIGGVKLTVLATVTRL